MEFKEVGGHTFCPELLGHGVIIDVGCRGFWFANHFIGKQAVYCIDPDPKVFEGAWADPVNFLHMNVAISDKNGEASYYENGEATCLQQIDPDQSHLFVPCKTITMDDLYNFIGVNIGTTVDVLKLDCEGAEYIILGETFSPIPKQITVEFHHHTVPELHRQHYESVKHRLSEHYEIFNDIWEKRHGEMESFWDVLFIRKDLL